MSTARAMPVRWDSDEAHIQVMRAIRLGVLAHPRGMKCVDCGSEAVEYEHRDYNEMLRVDPVCRRCNRLRGPAIPRNGSFARLVAYGWVPYRSRTYVQRILAAMGKEPSLLSRYPARLSIEHWRELVHVFPA